MCLCVRGGQACLPSWPPVEAETWREVTSCILRQVSNLGLDDTLFLIDSKLLKVNGLPRFYCGVFKSWALFKSSSGKSSNSVSVAEGAINLWCLRSSTTEALCQTRTLLLKQLVDAAGPALMDSEALGPLAGSSLSTLDHHWVFSPHSTRMDEERD